MMRCLVQPRDWILVKSNIGKNISKNLSGKYSQKIVDHAKQSTRYPLKTAPKGAIQKTAEATGDLILNKIASRITRTSEYSQ